MAKKKAVKKVSAKAKPVAKKTVKKPALPVHVHKPAPHVPATPPGRKLTAKEVREFKDILLTLRERVSGEYSTLSRDNLEANQRDPSLSDQGTDTFDREMELNMMGSEQEVIFEIDAALRRIEKGAHCGLRGLEVPAALPEHVGHPRPEFRVGDFIDDALKRREVFRDEILRH